MANEKIQRPNLIVCEGLDAKNYLIYFLEYFIKIDPRYELFQVMNAGGIGELPKFIKALPDFPDFHTAKTLTIVRDSETNSINAEKSIQSMLRNCNFSIPTSPCTVAKPFNKNHQVSICYALFPSLNTTAENGTLEDLCLRTLAQTNSKELLDIADGALNNVANQFGTLRHPHKNRLYTYLSLTNDFVGHKLGESAKAGAYNFAAPEIEPLKILLNSMLNTR